MNGAVKPTGLVVVDKPSGITSHDVVNRVRKVYGTSKVGHAGTLDPSATGVLLIGVGKATRILSFLQALPKAYVGVVRFGVTTTSQDADGDVVATSESQVEASDFQATASRFVGEITQLPPMFSAVKVGGEPLYRAARRGQEVQRSPRTVRIYELRVERFNRESREATIFVRCSSGTYIRSLAADLGEELGSGAHLAKLSRVGVGSFELQEAIPLARLEEMRGAEALAALLSIKEAMRDFPQVAVQGEELKAVTHGRSLASPAVPRRVGELPLAGVRRSGERPPHEAGMTAGVPVAIVGPEGEVIAVYRRSATGLKPAAVLV